MSQQLIKGATGGLGSGGSLDTYDVPGSVIITPYSVSVTFDGTGAAGPFLPCLTFKTQTGAVIARCPAPEVAAGDTAEVSWFPHVGGQTTQPVPGQILGTFSGNLTAADFTTNSTVYVASGFPANSTLSKVSNTSALDIVMEGLFLTGTAPDILYLGMFIDGTLAGDTAMHVSVPSNNATAVVNFIYGLAGSLTPPLSAGNHTITVRTRCFSGNNFTLRTSSGIGLSIIEYES